MLKYSGLATAGVVGSSVNILLWLLLITFSLCPVRNCVWNDYRSMCLFLDLSFCWWVIYSLVCFLFGFSESVLCVACFPHMLSWCFLRNCLLLEAWVLGEFDKEC